MCIRDSTSIDLSGLDKLTVKDAIDAQRQLFNEREVACVKRGIVALEDHCRSFKYDPLKRVPPRPAKLETEELRQEDFQL